MVPLVPAVARGWTATAAVAVVAPIPLPLTPIPVPVPIPFPVPIAISVPLPLSDLAPVTFEFPRASVSLGLGRSAALFQGIAADQGGGLLGGILATLLR